MAKYYFSRSCDPNPLAWKWLISGVIEASSLDEAKGDLDAALIRLQTTDRASSFTFTALDSIEKTDGGLLAITMGSP